MGFRIFNSFLNLVLILGCSHPGTTKDASSGRAPASLANVDFEAAMNLTARSGYVTKGLCGGYPRIPHLITPPGFCVGQVATGFRMPRGVLEFDPDTYPNQFLVTDMGSWDRNSGILWLVRPAGPGEQVGPQFEMIRLLENLDLPHSVVLGAEREGRRTAWVATATRVLRVHVIGLGTARPHATSEVMIEGLPGKAPAGQNYRHPLKTIVFDRKGALWVNVGSHSNNCEDENIAKNLDSAVPVLCQEAEGKDPNGSIRRFEFDWSVEPPRLVKSSVVARGLRNSVALTAYARNGLILQAENSRDAIHKADPGLSDDSLPHEEINVIQPGKHYGWPYCYDGGETSPEFRKYRTRAGCSTREPPAVLLPAHSAPLGMVYYRRSLFPRWYRNKLLVSLHGYRSTGHRLVAFDTRPDGVPFGQSYDLISGWEAGTGGPLGAPVQIALAADGAVYIVEDKNRTLLKLFYEGPRGGGIPLPSPTFFPSAESAGESTEKIAARCRALSAKRTTWARIERELIDVSCVNCHRSGDLALRVCDDEGNARLLRGEGGGKSYIHPGDAEGSLFYQRLVSSGAPMPPYPSTEEKEKLQEIIPLVKSWINEGASNNSTH